MNTRGGWVECEPTDALERLALGLSCLGSGMMSYQGRCPKCGRAFGPGEMPEHEIIDRQRLSRPTTGALWKAYWKHTRGE